MYVYILFELIILYIIIATNKLDESILKSLSFEKYKYFIIINLGNLYPIWHIHKILRLLYAPHFLPCFILYQSGINLSLR